nr:MAG TPA: hypothetical protein [Caudoviricetes sp.]
MKEYLEEFLFQVLRQTQANHISLISKSNFLTLS